MTCKDLTEFCDGEMSNEAADKFRLHLKECPTCPKDLVEAMALAARLSFLGYVHNDVVDQIIDTLNSLEQRAVFVLMWLGVDFNRMTLYREHGTGEQGVQVDGKKACSISIRWPTTEEVANKKNKPATATIEMKFLEPFDYLNK